MEATKKQNKEKIVIGVGSSAGGIKALQSFFEKLPKDSGFAVVVAQHLSPVHKSSLPQIIQKSTKLQVQQASNGLSLDGGNIYIAPPDNDIEVRNGKIVLSPSDTDFGPKPSVNKLLYSIAQEYKENSIAVILSGTGTDGAAGSEYLQSSGGKVLVQNPNEAAFDGMPLATLSHVAISVTANASELGDKIKDFILNNEPLGTDEIIETSSDALTKILKILEQHSGVDFRRYKLSTIERRLNGRMLKLGLYNFEDYIQQIKERPSELQVLFEYLLIGVTEFFREPDAFKALEGELEKYIIDYDKQDLRFWVPGCASGEEAYSLAIIVSEINKRLKKDIKLQIFATDIDRKALQTGRKGIYYKDRVDGLPKDIISRYFKVKDNYYEVNKDLRSKILFSNHDLTANAPFSKIDLVTCRNLFIYFNRDLQNDILPLLHYSLNENGILFMGKSENISNFGSLFKTIAKKHRIWRKINHKKNDPIKLVRFKSNTKTKNTSKPLSAYSKGIREMVQNSFYQELHHPYVVVNTDMELEFINGDPDPFVKLGQGAVTNSLVKLLHPMLQIEVQDTIRLAQEHNEMTVGNFHVLKDEANTKIVRPVVYPIFSLQGLFFIIVFDHFLLKELPRVNKDLGSLHEQAEYQFLQQELISTREHLQSYVEELETSNEEMQALNEELQSTNEELQSLNEELETSNEELQSTNEEMQVAYQQLDNTHNELKKKDFMLEENISFLEAILDNNEQAIFIIDHEDKLTRYNAKAKTVLKNLGETISLDTSIYVQLPKEWNATIEDYLEQANKKDVWQKEITFENSKKRYVFMLSITKIKNNPESTVSKIISLFDVTKDTLLNEQLSKVNLLMNQVGQIASIGGWELDVKTGNITRTEENYRIHGLPIGDSPGLLNSLEFFPQDARKEMADLVDNLIKSGTRYDAVLPFVALDNKAKYVRVTGRPFYDKNGQITKVWGTIQDITDQHRRRLEIEALNEELQRSNKELTEFAYIASHDLQEPLRMISSFTQLLADRYKDKLDEKAQDYISYAVNGAKRMKEMITDLLEYSRVNTSVDEVTDISLEGIINDVKLLLKSKIENTGALISVGTLPEIKGIRVLVSRLFQNLIDNAIKYTEERPIIHISSREDSAYTYIDVKDQGIGINPNKYEDIFVIFRRLHGPEAYEGNGMGLAVCKRIMLRHNGNITVKSQLGKGSTFTVSFPKPKLN
jgi:two-component system CheB/CheR fusion protein